MQKELVFRDINPLKKGWVSTKSFKIKDERKSTQRLNWYVFLFPLQSVCAFSVVYVD